METIKEEKKADFKLREFKRGTRGLDADYKAWCILIAICGIGLLLYILSPIIIAIERYYGIDV